MNAETMRMQRYLKAKRLSVKTSVVSAHPQALFRCLAPGVAVNRTILRA